MSTTTATIKMPIEIRETTITTDVDATIVRLQIADAPLDETAFSFRLNLLVQLPRYQSPYIAQVQREAILEAREVLGKMSEALLQTLPRDAHARPNTI
jgi:hypothetical protein